MDDSSTVTQEEIVLIKQFQKWGLIFWIYYFVEHIPITLGFLHLRSLSFNLFYLFTNYNCWFWVFSFNVVCSWYFVDPHHRPTKFRSLAPIYTVAAIQILNIIICTYWTIINCWIERYCIDYLDKKPTYGVIYLCGIIIIYVSFPLLIKLLKIEKKLYDLWSTGDYVS